MNAIARVVVGLLAGFVVFLATAVAGIELFFPRIEFSVFVGVPAGFWAGIAATALVVAGLWYRDQPAPRPRNVTRVFRATVAVAAAVALTYAVGGVWFFVLGGNLAVLLFVYGTPLVMVVAAIAALRRGNAGENDGETTGSPVPPRSNG